jgi:hypothetical protein
MSLKKRVMHYMNHSTLVIGMKLGTFLDPGNGNKKLVIWSEEKAYMYPFNTDQNEMMNNKSLKNN